jgi:hypothetical protein
MFSKRELEGYLEIDHRESPGITPELAAKIGCGTIPVGAGQTLKAATYNCPYCEALIVRNPERERERAYCRKLDRYICDGCDLKRKLGVELKPMKQVIDEFIDAATKNQTPPTPNFGAAVFQFRK